MHGVTLVFDLDGTLIDTAPDLARATNHVLEREGLAAIPAESIRNWIGFGARRMVERGLSYHGTERSPAELDRLLEHFIDHYAANIAIESRPFPLLTQTLDRLAASGAKLAVCTNKREGLSRQLLAALGLSERFAAVAGGDTFPVRKPHPDHLTGTVKRAGGEVTRSIFVGDSETDVLTARAAGIPIIGVSFGYTDVPMRELSPDAVIDHYAELGKALERLLFRL
jgi:phosphoglycolate phosphatase